MRQCNLILLALIFYSMAIAAQNRPTSDFFAFSSQNGSSPLLRKCFMARDYDRYHGATRLALVQELQDKDWQAVDSTYGLPEKDGIGRMRLDKVDLAPYVNEEGYIVYWVPEVARAPPGATGAGQQVDLFSNKRVIVCGSNSSF